MNHSNRPAVEALEHFVKEAELFELLGGFQRTLVLRASVNYPLELFGQVSAQLSDKFLLHQTSRSECLALEARKLKCSQGDTYLFHQQQWTGKTSDEEKGKRPDPTQHCLSVESKHVARDAYPFPENRTSTHSELGGKGKCPLEPAQQFAKESHRFPEDRPSTPLEVGEEVKDPPNPRFADPSGRPHFSAALFLPTRQKQESLYWLAVAINAIEDGGYLISSCENNLGAKSYVKALQELGLSVATASKARSTAFCAEVHKENLDQARINEWLSFGDLRPIANSPYYTRVGIFSVDELDNASTFLLESIPKDLQGSGADLGAGNGYLGLEILRSNDNVRKVTLYENEKMALEAAERSTNEMKLSQRTNIVWADLTKEPPTEKFDWIVMNPPFHNQQSEDRGLGEKFIDIASKSLRNGGRLFMVANDHLPYSKKLEKVFARVKAVNKRAGFVVYESVSG